MQKAGYDRIVVDCRICPRHGEYVIARLLEQYSPDLLVAAFVNRAAADCRYRCEQGHKEICGAYCGDADALQSQAPANPYAKAKGGAQ
ncbi:hypothetical protein [Rhizobium sp. WYJ-E13]|uniref:hypothetical protein n=1 Tax=Rhizobium sp. WYJ-E13 TaxID=2849093 RepID=UPI001C1E9B5C|nr:hypothetical protein [Rhizobium sp. WYJ-E13]QWW70006.1 hypothetical protein KQ933_10025 [Rhizobium sp. WYJ-E13]